MKRKIIFWLIALSLLLHTPWELIQLEWVVNVLGKPGYIKLRNASVGISLDTVYTLGVYYLLAWYKDNKTWIMYTGVKDYLIIIFISLLAAYGYEWMGWKLDLWSFADSMPHLGKVALSPLIQLPFLVCATFFITQCLLSSNATTDLKV